MHSDVNPGNNVLLRDVLAVEKFVEIYSRLNRKV